MDGSLESDFFSCKSFVRGLSAVVRGFQGYIGACPRLSAAWDVS